MVTPVSSDKYIGEQVAGQFHIRQRIGAGGMGDITGRLRALFFGGRGDGNGANEARVERGGDAALGKGVAQIVE